MGQLHQLPTKRSAAETCQGCKEWGYPLASYNPVMGFSNKATNKMDTIAFINGIFRSKQPKKWISLMETLEGYSFKRNDNALFLRAWSRPHGIKGVGLQGRPAPNTSWETTTTLGFLGLGAGLH